MAKDASAPDPKRILDRLRRIALSLPAAVETTSFGHPTFKVGAKTFAVFEPYRGEYAICVKATLEDQALLVMDPRFYVAPYVGKHGWTSMRVTGGIDAREVEELVRASYRLVASKRQRDALEPASPSGPRARAPRKK